MDINLNLYKTFYQTAQCKTYVEASEKMNITRNAISKSIITLENLLDTKLFYRESNGINLTADGKELYKFVDKSLNILEAGEKLIAQRNNIENGEIIIGALSHLSNFILIDKIKEVKKDYPNLKIKLLTGATGRDLIRLLEEHKIDFAIDSTSTINIKNEDMVKEELMSIENIFIANKPLKIKSKEEFEKYKFILGSQTAHSTQDLINMLKEQNVNIKSDIEIDITELRVSAAKEGIGISYLMKDSVRKELERKEVYEVEIPFKLPESKINLIYFKEELNKADKKFIKEYLKK